MEKRITHLLIGFVLGASTIGILDKQSQQLDNQYTIEFEYNVGDKLIKSTEKITIDNHVLTSIIKNDINCSFEKMVILSIEKR